MKKTATLAALAAAIACLALPVHPAAAVVVRDVRIQWEGPACVGDSFVLALFPPRPGDELDRATVSRGVRSLLDSKRFAHVNVLYDRQGDDGVVLTCVLRARLRLAERVSVVGPLSSWRCWRLARKVELKEHDYIDEAILAEGARLIRESLQKRKYPDPEISWTTNLVDPARCLAAITYQVAPGHKTWVAGTTFQGNTAIPDDELRAAMGYRPFWSPRYWFGKPAYDEIAIQDGARQVVQLYQDRGYLDASVARIEALPRSHSRGRTIRLSVREGTRYAVGNVAVHGVSIYPTNDIRRLLLVRPGSIASAGAIRRSEEAVQSFYRRRGYMRAIARADAVARPDSPVVDLNLSVAEGSLVHIRNIDIRGNGRTRDKVIRRELLVNPGDIYNEARVDRSTRRLRNLNYFQTVRAFTEPTDDPDSDDLIFEVDEKQTGEFSIGGGFSSEDRFLAYVTVEQRNFNLSGQPSFTGGGQKIRATVQYGAKSRSLSVMFTEPWFMDQKLALTLEAYGREKEYDEYEEQAIGGAIGLRKSLWGRNSVSLKYRIEEVITTNEYADVFGADYQSVYGEPARVERLEGSLAARFDHRSTDHPTIPSRGMQVQLESRLFDPSLGSDVQVYEASLRSALFVPLWARHVLSLHVRGDFVDCFGDTETVPLSHRLFAGGPRTIRGFDLRSVGPKWPPDPSDDAYADWSAAHPDATPSEYASVGGTFRALGTIEYTIPLPEVPLRLAAFYDTGAVWAQPEDVDAESLVSSAGLGLYFDIPGFPVQVTYAWPIDTDEGFDNPKAELKEEPFGFSVGYKF